MAIFKSPDGRTLDEVDVLKAVKYYEFLFNGKHRYDVPKSSRSNRGGTRPKPAAKIRESLGVPTGSEPKVVAGKVAAKKAAVKKAAVKKAPARRVAASK